MKENRILLSALLREAWQAKFRRQESENGLCALGWNLPTKMPEHRQRIRDIIALWRYMEMSWR